MAQARFEVLEFFFFSNREVVHLHHGGHIGSSHNPQAPRFVPLPLDLKVDHLTHIAIFSSYHVMKYVVGN